MSIIHMQVDEVHGLAGEICYCGETIYDAARAIRQRAFAIEWQGTSREDFVYELDHLLARINQNADAIEQLGYTLQLETAKWEAVAASLAGVRDY
jgi:uncharacterized protein YukE